MANRQTVTVAVLGLCIVILVGGIILFPRLFGHRPTPQPVPPKPSATAKPKIDQKALAGVKSLLETWMNKKDHESETKLVEELSCLGDPACLILQKLYDEAASDEVRATIVKALGLIKRPDGISILCDAASKSWSGNSSLAKSEVTSIAMIGGLKAAEALMQLLEKCPEQIVADIASALGAVATTEQLPRLREMSAKLSNQGLKPHLADIIATVEKKELDSSRQVELAKLDLSKPESLKRLSDALNGDESPALKLQAVSLLEKAGSAESVAVLIEFVRKCPNDTSLVPTAIGALIRLSAASTTPQADDLLKEVLQGALGAGLRRVCVDLIGAYGREKHADMLKALLDSCPAELRPAVEAALKKLKDR